MSDCSLIATRNVHAKHNKLVCHVGYTVLTGHRKFFDCFCHIIDTFLTFSLSCACADGKISRFSTLNFAA